MSHSLTHYVCMVYYNKIALIQQIWYFRVFSWSLICSPNVRKKCKKMCQKISRKIYRKKQSRINARKGVRRYVRRMIADMSEYIYVRNHVRGFVNNFRRQVRTSISLYIYIHISIIRMHVRSKKWSGDMSTLEVCNRVMAQSKEELARLLGGWRASAMQTLGTWCTRRWCPRSLAKLVYHCQNLSLW